MLIRPENLDLKKIFPKGLDEVQIQPNGIDLTVLQIESFRSSGVIGFTDRVKPETEVIYNPCCETARGYELKPTESAYLIRYAEYVRIPNDLIALVYPRSSLMRMGATIYTAVWDSGYEGRGVGLLKVFNPITIKYRARVAQMIFLECNRGRTYNGEYKYETE